MRAPSRSGGRGPTRRLLAVCRTPALPQIVQRSQTCPQAHLLAHRGCRSRGLGARFESMLSVTLESPEVSLVVSGTLSTQGVDDVQLWEPSEHETIIGLTAFAALHPRGHPPYRLLARWH